VMEELKMMVDCYFLLLCLPLSFCLVDHGQPTKLQPSFTNLLVNRSIGVDRDVTFTCSVKNLGRYKVGWVKADTKAIQAIGNQIITHNARVSVSGDFKSTFNLHIKQVAVEDAGNYMCQVNTDPMTFQTAHMAVMVPPDIDMTRTSGDITAREHSDTAQLECAANGVPQPKIAWKREGGLKIRTKNAQHAHRMVEIVRSNRLEIHKVRREDMGAYLCIASNDVPPAVSKRVYLMVQFPPSILPGLSVVGSAEGQKLTLECIVESYPEPYVVWRRGDEILPEGDRLDHTITETPLAMYRMASKLTLTSYKSSQAGVYKCVGTNSLGEAELTTRVYTTASELVPPREPKYEIILDEEEQQEQEEEREKSSQEKRLSKKERRKKKKYRQNKFTLPEGGHGGSQHDNGQDPASHFPGLLSSSCPPSLPSAPGSFSAISIFIMILFYINTLSNLPFNFITLSLFSITIILSLFISLSPLSLEISSSSLKPFFPFLYGTSLLHL